MQTLDFNQIDDDQGGYSLVPNGEEVCVELELEESKYGTSEAPYIIRSQNGLYRISTKMTVISKRFEGFYWYQDIVLPEFAQPKDLPDNLQKAAQIGGVTIRRIIEAARGIARDDKSEKAASARCIQSWSELEGMRFAVKVAKKEDYKGKMRNSASQILGIDAPSYREFFEQGLLRINKLPEAPSASATYSRADDDLPF